MILYKVICSGIKHFQAFEHERCYFHSWMLETHVRLEVYVLSIRAFIYSNDSIKNY